MMHEGVIETNNSSEITAIRYHDISCGHRVMGHENKCSSLHGHNYRIHFHCIADRLDDIGRVIDFSVIKGLLCEWVERNWDHKFLIYVSDIEYLKKLEGLKGLKRVTFNPTAENMAKYLVDRIGPSLLDETGVILKKVVIEETRKCSASYERT